MRFVALEGFLIHAQIAGVLDQPLAVDLDILVGVDGRALDLRAAVGVALGKDQVVLQVPLAVGNGVALEPDDRVVTLMQGDLGVGHGLLEVVGDLLRAVEDELAVGVSRGDVRSHGRLQLVPVLGVERTEILALELLDGLHVLETLYFFLECFETFFNCHNDNLLTCYLCLTFAIRPSWRRRKPLPWPRCPCRPFWRCR